MWPQDIAASRAHARMLGARGSSPARTPPRSTTGLDAASRSELARGTFAFAPGDEDIHTAVERRLTELVGRRRPAPAHRAQPQRPGHHRHAAVPARALRRGSGRGCAALAEALIAQAEHHLDTLLPGYTHGQRAQPVRLAHHLLAYVWMLDRDRRPPGGTPIDGDRRVPARLRRPRRRRLPGRPRRWWPRSSASRGPTPEQPRRGGQPRRPGRLPALRGPARRAPVAPRRRDRAVGRRRGRLRRARRRVHAPAPRCCPRRRTPTPPSSRAAKAPRLAADLSGLLGVTVRSAARLQQGPAGGQGVPVRRRSTRSTCSCPAMTGMIAGAAFRADRMAAACAGGVLARDRPGRPPGRARVAVPARPRGRRAAGALRASSGASASRTPTTAELAAAGLAGVDAAGARRRRRRSRPRPAPGGTARATVVAQLDAARRAGGGVVSAGRPRRPAAGATRLDHDFFARPVGEVARDLLGCTITVGRRRRDDRRDRAVPAGRPRIPQLPGPHPAGGGDVRAAGPPVRLPELRRALVRERGLRACGQWRGRPAAGARPDRTAWT